MSNPKLYGRERHAARLLADRDVAPKLGEEVRRPPTSDDPGVADAPIASSRPPRNNAERRAAGLGQNSIVPFREWIGRLDDALIAQLSGRSEAAVARYRERAGIPAAPEAVPFWPRPAGVAPWPMARERDPEETPVPVEVEL